MADSGESLSPEEIVLQRHRKERKDLQHEISKLKHSVSKGDKKRKKEVTAEIARMEAELSEKQDKELADVKEGKLSESNGVEKITNDLAAAAVLEEMGFNVEPSKPKKPSKAQRRREKKAAHASEREQEIAQAEEDNLLGARHLEAQALKSRLGARNLSNFEIPSDGNCLYAAVVHQLKGQDITASVDSLRKQTAEYMRGHRDDFLPFLCRQDTGDPYTPEEFEEYCEKLANTAEWGGQLEIQALSNVLSAPIEVIQAEGPSITTGEHFTNPAIQLSYHRHMYGLGEHYNSVVPKSPDEEEDDFR